LVRARKSQIDACFETSRSELIGVWLGCAVRVRIHRFHDLHLTTIAKIPLVRKTHCMYIPRLM
jgi:hypothetical protein